MTKEKYQNSQLINYYRPDIDGLRAIAVSSVLIFHAFPKFLPGGFIGVDIFFVISGFLISSILLKSINNQQFSIIDFYKRRILRIYPALIAVILFCLLIGWFLLFADEFSTLGKHVVGGAAFVSNLLLWSESSYFNPDAITKPLLHFWSLAVEEQFYIFWPLILWIIAKYKINFLKVVSAIASVSFLMGIFYLYKKNPTAAFFSPLPRFWELMAGGALAYISLFNSQLLKPFQNYRSWVGIFLIFSGFLLINESKAFPGFWAILPVFGAVLLISGNQDSFVNKHLLSAKPLVALGLISYPLYLWHWPLLSFLQVIGGSVDPLHNALALVLALILATVTYWFIEKPLRYNKNKNRTALVLFISMILMGIMGFIIMSNHGFKGYGVRTIEKTEYLDFFENSKPQWNYFKKINRAEKYRYECDFYDLAADQAGHRSVVPLEKIAPACYTRDLTFSKSILIWGDSHAQMLSFGVKTTIPADWQLLQVASSGCRPAIVKTPSKSFYCNQSNWFALETIRNSKPNVVLIAQKSGHDAEKMHVIEAYLKDIGVDKIVFTGPTPEWTPSLPRVVAGLLWDTKGARSWRGLDTRVKAENDALVHTLNNYPDIHFVNLFDNLCNYEGCLIYLNDNRKEGIMSYDYGHLTPLASQYVVQNMLLPSILAPDSQLK